MNERMNEHEHWSSVVNESHCSSSVGVVVLERASLIDRGIEPARIEDRSSQARDRVRSVTTTTTTRQKQQRAVGSQEENLTWQTID